MPKKTPTPKKNEKKTPKTDTPTKKDREQKRTPARSSQANKSRPASRTPSRAIQQAPSTPTPPPQAIQQTQPQTAPPLSPTDALRKISLFEGLSDADLTRVTEIMRPKSYKKGQTIFLAGDDEGFSLFVIRSGTVKISIANPNGNEIILKLMHPGDFFGDMALLDGEPRCATVETLEEVKAYAISQDHFLNLIQQHPTILRTVLRVLCQRIRQMDEKLVIATFRARGKVACALVYLTKKQGNPRQGGQTYPLLRQDLANLAGVARQTLTNVLRFYKKAKVIQINERSRVIQILDEARLQADCKAGRKDNPATNG